MLNSLRQKVTQDLCRIQPLTEEQQKQMIAQYLAQQAAAAAAAAAPAAVAAAAEPAPAPAEAPAPATLANTARPEFDEADPVTWGNPARNDTCPCGSGEKFKHCHGKLA